MSTLHERLLAELDRLDPHRLTTLGKVTAAVLELHAPEVVPAGYNLVYTACSSCVEQSEQAAWPCSTIQAIARELGVSEPEAVAIEKLIDDAQQEGREQAARELAREADRVQDLGGAYNAAVAVGLDAAVRLLRRTPDPGATPDPDRPWLICWAEHRGMLCDRKRGHLGDHVDIYGPLPDHTWTGVTP